MVKEMEEIRTTALEEWARDSAATLFPQMNEQDRFKLALGLLQARAAECRHLSTELMLTAHASGFGVAVSSRMGFALGDRAQRLEEFAGELAKQRGDLLQGKDTPSGA
jgi:hypothetical protein